MLSVEILLNLSLIMSLMMYSFFMRVMLMCSILWISLWWKASNNFRSTIFADHVSEFYSTRVTRIASYSLIFISSDASSASQMNLSFPIALFALLILALMSIISSKRKSITDHRYLNFLTKGTNPLSSSIMYFFIYIMWS